MGSHCSKQDSEVSDFLINRCPGRNRGIRNVVNKSVEQGSILSMNKEKSSFGIIPIKIEDSETEVCLEQHTKLNVVKRKKYKRSRKLNLKENSSEAEDFKPNSSYRTIGINREQAVKIRKPKNRKREKENHKLISDILTTIADLEATFIEEKKYERRLFTAVQAQIEELQQLSLSLHKEKGQNKRLKGLLDCYENECEDYGNYSRDQNIAENFKQTLLLGTASLVNLDRKLISTRLNSSLSPLLLQQKIDELSSSLSQCKAELCSKRKQCILSQCEQEELQSKCDDLTEKLQDSYQRINTLSQEIVTLKREKKVLKKSMNPQLMNETTSYVDDGISVRG